MEREDLFDYLAKHDVTEDTVLLEQEIVKKFEKNAALVCIDSTGFSRTVKKKGIIYFLLILAHMRKLATTEAVRSNAISYRSYADNFFAEFSTVHDALSMVLRLNIAIEQANFMLDKGKPYKICTGIGFGKVLYSSVEGPLGDQMNLASKLGEDTAKGDEILITQEVFENIDESWQTPFSKAHLETSGVSATYYKTTFKNLIHLL